MSDKASTSFVKSLRFTGSSTGLVKTLSGFKKAQHTVPDAVNAVTNAFLARLCNDELAESAESMFQQARELCSYKRKEISLNLGTPLAELITKDFTLTISYGFDGDDAGTYRTTWSLDAFRDLAFLQSEACEGLFSGRFSELVFSLSKGAPVERLIDIIEEDDELEMNVSYPSNCAHCMISVPGIEAQVRFDGSELSMIFPTASSPALLLREFVAVREAFRINKALAGVLG